MADRYADLRAALCAGPKGGKWTWKQVGSFSTPGCAVLWPDTSKGGVHYRRLDSGGGMEQADAEFIACSNPETILVLLADYDRMCLQVEWTMRHARNTLNTNSRDVDDWREDMQCIANSARAALAQERGESDGRKS